MLNIERASDLHWCNLEPAREIVVFEILLMCNTMTTTTSELERANSIPSMNPRSDPDLPVSTNLSRTQDLLFFEIYHLIWIENYNEWTFKMMDILKRLGLFKYYITQK